MTIDEVMTIDEAIQELKRQFLGEYDRQRVAKSVAIEALEQLRAQESILDKIIAEIERQEKWLMDAGCNTYNVDIAFSSIKLALQKARMNNEYIY